MLPMLATPIGVEMLLRQMYMPEFRIVKHILDLLWVPMRAPLTEIPWALPALMVTDIWAIDG